MGRLSSRLAANPAVHVVAKTRRVLSANRDFPGRGLSECIESFPEDRKSTRLNSSHSQISYAVFCLKKKKNHTASATRNACTASEPIVTRPHPCSLFTFPAVENS